MSKFFVGQRVRLVKYQKPTGVSQAVPVGEEGVISDTRFLPKGYPARSGILAIDSDCEVIFRSSGRRSSHTSLLEPILPEGASPSVYTFQQLMDSLQGAKA